MTQGTRQGPTPPVLRRKVLRPDAVLFQLSEERPDAKSLVIVLDLSDSCDRLRPLFERLPELAKAFPHRSWPLWFYRLSRSAPLDHGDFVIGDLQDGVRAIDALCPEGTTARDAQSRGSLFRPVYEAIIRRLGDQQVSEALVLVLTDGELLDATPLTLSAGIQVLGISTAPSPAAVNQHWFRVLPDCPLLTPDDPELPSLLGQQNNPFFDKCLVSWNSTVPGLEYAAIVGGQPRSQSQCRYEHNFGDADFHLLVRGPDAARATITFSCKHRRSSQAISAMVDPCEVTGDTVTRMLEYLQQEQQPLGEMVFDVNPTATGWDTLCADFTAARELAKAGKPWSDGNGALLVFNKAGEACNLSSICAGADALVCLAFYGSQGECVRLTAFRLKREHTPALRWVGQTPVGEARLDGDVTVEYDRLEARWMLVTSKGRTKELNPSGSDILPLPLKTDVTRVEAIFSGALR